MTKTNKELLLSIIMDCQRLMFEHLSQDSRGKRLEREIALLCKNLGFEIAEQEIKDLLYWQRNDPCRAILSLDAVLWSYDNYVSYIDDKGDIMKRTIVVKYIDQVYYRGRHISWLTPSIRIGFNIITEGKYEIAITKGKEYRFRAGSNTYNVCNKSGESYGGVCKRLFAKLFFKPDGRKRYDITVKKVK